MKQSTSTMLALWGWPIFLAVTSAVGLVGALWGGEGWAVLAWVGLGLPTVACLWFGLRGRGRR